MGFVHLRGYAATADLIASTSQPSRGLPTVAHAFVGKRERKMAERVGFVPWESAPINDLAGKRIARNSRNAQNPGSRYKTGTAMCGWETHPRVASPIPDSVAYSAQRRESQLAVKALSGERSLAGNGPILSVTWEVGRHSDTGDAAAYEQLARGRDNLGNKASSPCRIGDEQRGPPNSVTYFVGLSGFKSERKLTSLARCSASDVRNF